VLEDLRAARPTNLGATPAFWNMLHALFRERCASEPATLTVDVRENRAAGHIRALLGGRLIAATSGGAPLAEAVKDFVRRRLGVDLRSLYGRWDRGKVAPYATAPRIPVPLVAVARLAVLPPTV